MQTLPILPATIIGCWSFPGWYARFCDEAARDPDLYGPHDREEALLDAVRLAVDDQRLAGADILTDGEMARVDFNLGFYDFLSGLDPLPQGRLWGPPAHDQRARYQCLEPLSAPEGLGIVAEYRRLREVTTAPVKVPIPGPYTLAGCIDGGEVYENRTAVAEALVPFVHQEMRLLAKEGVEFLQLDEPSFACHPAHADLFLDLIARTVQGVKAKISLHMCFGNYRGRAVGQRSYRPLFPHLARAPVQQLALEFASREMAEIELAGEIEPPMELAVGLIDVKNSWVEPSELVADRLRQVMKYIELERLHVTPDCGFWQTARYLARRKLANMVEGVRTIRRELRKD